MTSREFPFWRLVGAIALGVSLANVAAWVAVESRLRWELHQAVEALRIETERAKAEGIKRLQDRQRAEFEKRQQSRDAQARSEAAEAAQRAARRAASERDAREGEYFPPADDSMPVNSFGCRNRVIVRRTADGWIPTLDGSGKPAGCRIEP